MMNTMNLRFRQADEGPVQRTTVRKEKGPLHGCSYGPSRKLTEMDLMKVSTKVIQFQGTDFKDGYPNDGFNGEFAAFRFVQMMRKS